MNVMEKNEIKNVGTARENSFQNGNSYNIKLDKDQFNKLSDNKGKVLLGFVKKDEVEKDGSTHDIRIASKDEKNDLLVEVSKDGVARLKDNQGSIDLEAVQKREIGKDRANYHVRGENENGEKDYVGRGWTKSQEIKHDYVGTAIRKDFDNGGKTYALVVDAEKFKELKANEFGNVNISLSQRQEKEDHYSAYKSIGKEPYSDFSLSLKKAEVEKMTINDKGAYSMIVADKNSIGKDKADLTVYENTFEKDKKAAAEKGVDIKEIKSEKNYVGSGWSNKHEHIRLQESDKTKEGLSKAILNNHGLKVAAILKNENIADKSHLKLINEMKEKGTSVDKEMDRMVNKYSQANEQNQSSKMKV
jgi:hypothetical protein